MWARGRMGWSVSYHGWGRGSRRSRTHGRPLPPQSRHGQQTKAAPTTDNLKYHSELLYGVPSSTMERVRSTATPRRVLKGPAQAERATNTHSLSHARRHARGAREVPRLHVMLPYEHSPACPITYAPMRCWANEEGSRCTDGGGGPRDAGHATPVE